MVGLGHFPYLREQGKRESPGGPGFHSFRSTWMTDATTRLSAGPESIDAYCPAAEAWVRVHSFGLIPNSHGLGDG